MDLDSSPNRGVGSEVQDRRTDPFRTLPTILDIRDLGLSLESILFGFIFIFLLMRVWVTLFWVVRDTHLWCLLYPYFGTVNCDDCMFDLYLLYTIYLCSLSCVRNCEHTWRGHVTPYIIILYFIFGV